MENRATIKDLARWLLEHDDFALFGHVMPDGDAVGSCMAVCLALREIGKKAMVCLPNPVPKMYAHYPHADEALVPGMMLPFIPQTGFALDTSEIERLGNARAMFEGCPAKAMLDHHETNPGYGDIWHVEGARSATGEMALELIEAMGAPLTKEIATWLYIAISTDSGHFRFAGTNSATMNAAGRLIDAGVDVPRVTRELYHTSRKSRVHLLGLALAQLQVSEDGLMAWTAITADMLEKAGATSEDKEGVVNFLLEIEGVEFAALAEERGEATKFSLRSKEWLDVAGDVAAHFSGGGHLRAAGCTLNCSVPEALEQVLARAAEMLKKRP